MDRARRAGWAALFVVVLVVSTVGGGSGRVQAAVVAWPTSTLVISEFQTGGASASDEFVEIANQGTAAIDLVGLEVVYATSSGSTVTRKGTWAASTILAPGQRVLLANSAGVQASIADATYSGGFAATGGALTLRVVGGPVIDAVGWGDATSAFVEGSVAPAPAAGSSLERGPGGLAGNGSDTNDNLADWFVQGAPSPQNLAAPFVPDAAGPSPTPSATPLPTPTPSESPTPTATATSSPTASPTPMPTAASTPSPIPTPSPTPASTPSPTGSPTPAPTPTASPTPLSIVEARQLPDGSTALIEGILTTDLGALETGHGGFVQDASGGIAIYLDDPVVGSLPAGTTVRIFGEIGSRFAQRTVRAPETAVVREAAADLPAPIGLETGTAGEGDEGRRVTVSGEVTEAPDQLADGLGITIDDGSGPVRAVIAPPAVGGRTIAGGMTATVTGPLGQRDSSGAGTSGYRVYATLVGELELIAATPTPTQTPTPTPTAVASPTPGPSATPTASTIPTTSPGPTPAPSAVSIAIVRTLPVGTRVTTTGIVIAEAGRVGSPSLLAIHDGTTGLIVHGATDAQALLRGTRIEVTGKLAAPYGQLEIRPSETDVRVLGAATPPLPATLGSDPLGEGDEGQFVTIAGLLETKPTKSSSGDITLTLARDGAAAVKVMADATSKVTIATFQVGSTYRVTGIVGQRASRTGALDGYRIWIRDAADVAVVAAPIAPSPTGSLATTPNAAAHPVVSIEAALRIRDRDVRIEGIVTIPATLLDATGRRLVVQDGSAAVELLLPTGTIAPPVGTRLRAAGRIGLAYGAPRLRAATIEVLGSSAAPRPITLHVLPGLAHEWQLVTIGGRVSSVHKLGDRWRAEIMVGGKPAVVVGQPGSGIASSTLVEGRQASVTGIVRRPYPNATDRRFAVTPRFPADVRRIGGGGGATAGEDAGRGGGNLSAGGSGPGASPAQVDAVDIDVIDLGSNIGRTVRIGGLVVELRPDGFTLDDGTAIGRVELRGPALDELDLVEPDDALNVIGHVEQGADGPIVVVDDAGHLIFAGDPVPGGASADASMGAIVTQPSGSPEAALETPLGGRLAAFGGGPFGFDGGLAGLGTLVTITGLSVAITMLRRRHLRRRLAARIATRLATVAGPRPASAAASADAPDRPSSAERGPSTIRSA
jgi:hypothetical protein